eukprot:SAG31_NODE_1971_length_6758_cov_3.905205_3_plen_96_part_00
MVMNLSWLDCEETTIIADRGLRPFSWRIFRQGIGFLTVEVPQPCNFRTDMIVWFGLAADCGGQLDRCSIAFFPLSIQAFGVLTAPTARNHPGHTS